MEKKYFRDVCEQLKYEYYEPGEEIVIMNQCQYKDDKGNNQIYDKAFILLDGSVDFLIDLFDP